MVTLSPSSFGSFGDETAFQLPVPGLLADIECGSGSVRLTDEFLEAPPNVRLQVLDQWLRGLKLQRDSALVDLFREVAAPWRGLTVVEQIERFRQHCTQKGTECPPELPLLLQRF